MNYQSIDYPVTGDSFNTDYPLGSNQRSLNMYIELLRNGITDAAMVSFPGLKSFISASGNGKGIYYFNGKGFHLNGSTLYSFDSAGTLTSVGSIPGSGDATFRDNGSVMLILRDSRVYESDGLTVGMNSHLSSFLPTAMDILNQQFIFTTQNNTWVVTDAGTTQVSTGIGSAEQSVLVAPFVYNDFLFLFAEDKVLPWENTGIGAPPFQRLNGAITDDVGLVGSTAVGRSKKAMYFLSPDGNAYQMQTFVAEAISSTARAREWQAYTTMSDCKVKVIDTLGHVFVLFIFPTAKKVHVYDETIGNWFELDSGAEGARWLGQDTVYTFGKTLVSDYSTGNIYELDKETHQNNGDYKIRERVFRPFSGETFKKPRQKLQSKELRLTLETDSTDSEQVMVSFSKNGGRSFGGERWLSLGEAGDYIQKVRTTYKQKFYDLLVKVRFSANADLALYTTGLDVRGAGGR